MMNHEKQLPATQWIVKDAGPEDIIASLTREFSVSRIVSKLILNRHVASLEDAHRYLHPSLNHLHSPFLMQDMKKGVARIISAIHAGEEIVIYGDYDADGITSVVILYKFIKQLTSKVSYYIPDRVLEGYGLKNNVIDKFKNKNVKLIITVDCGISDVEQIAYARSIGMDTIVLDHHEISDQLPAAVACINPNRSDCAFPFKNLAGVGIAFNFLIALRGTLRKEGFWKDGQYPNLREYLDIVALGTIGDIAPLIDENRIFARIGLELLTEGKRPGIKALKEVSGIDGQLIDSFKASFCLIPRINAAGRIASPLDAVDLLLSETLEEARPLAEKLDLHNRRRQAMEKDILKEILGQLGTNPDLDNINALVFSSEKWHPGVVGIVASRLVDLFSRPAFVISLKDGVGKGSGRSVADFNIHKGLQQCASLLLSFGGHYRAAGISIKEDDIDEFACVLDDIIRNSVSVVEKVSATMIDSECSLEDINFELIEQITQLAPFGCENPEPVLCARGIRASSTAIVGANHLRMRLTSNNTVYNAIWFSMGRHISAVNGATLDIVFSPQINYWNGTSEIQLKMKDAAIVA
ncbi:MAG TPA: single-stranded-DNA-specific exonuclease RecJ [Smithellaceae bacterium]|jgi:single-stranded-DNA-specific exonuclease|nr:single-stranded-DNA-specific exonuclease RecJ [Smithellaceae bacterium]HQM46468.1 single-stranded-DNA-specific exonuclease RecJ [Smithellaceae bacterium]